MDDLVIRLSKIIVAFCVKSFLVVRIAHTNFENVSDTLQIC